MKYVLVVVVLFMTMISCDKDGNDNCNIEGRWINEAFDNTLYEFQGGLRYTIYSVDGSFGTIEDAIPNPNDYTETSDSLIIDLNFGNFQRSAPVYKCDCNVLELNAGASLYYKEGYNIEDCDE